MGDVDRFVDMAPSVRKELDRRNLCFDRFTSHGILRWADAFGSSQALPEIWFLAFRVICATIMTGTLIGAVCTDREYFPIFLTNWTLTLQVVYLNLAVYTTWSLQPLVKENIHGEYTTMPVYVRVLWLLQGIVFPATFMVFLMFWTLDYEGGTPPAVDVLCHGVNFLVQLLDKLLSSQPYLLLHGFYGWIYACLFLGWSVVHYAARIGDGDGDYYIYDVLDWSDPGNAAVVTVVSLVAVPFVILILWGLIFMCRSPLHLFVNEEDNGVLDSAQGGAATRPHAVKGHPQHNGENFDSICNPICDHTR